MALCHLVGEHGTHAIDGEALSTAAESAVGMSVGVDLVHGGRLTSLTSSSGREWLWHRASVTERDGLGEEPGFVDIGGADECVPTISGSPDHGAVWWRRWSGRPEDAIVESERFSLRRRITAGERIVIDYELSAETGYRFIWAWHALVVPELGLELSAPEGHRVRAWPVHDGPVIEANWPSVLGERVDRLGSDDGSALFFLLPHLDELTLLSGEEGLRIRLSCEGQPIAMGIWRNLGGFPSGAAPYRSLGIEPMLGHAHNAAQTQGDELACVPAGGVVSWRLVVEETPGNGGFSMQSAPGA